MAIETRTDTEILRAARERISDQRHFVMGALAWDRTGKNVDPLSPEAWRWNARGAIHAESGLRPLPFRERDRDHALYRALDAAAAQVSEANGIRFPAGTDLADNLGHALTLRALDIAIAAGDEPPAARAAVAGAGR